MAKAEYKPNIAAYQNRSKRNKPGRASTQSVFRSPAGNATVEGLGYVFIPPTKLKWPARTNLAQRNAESQGRPENLPAFLAPKLKKDGTPYKKQPRYKSEHFAPGTGPTKPRDAKYTGPPPRMPTAAEARGSLFQPPAVSTQTYNKETGVFE